jgi:dihydropteroate synthase
MANDLPNAGLILAPTWRTRRSTVALDRPFLLGILNVTPDSFSDGGRFESSEAAVAHAREMVSQGADAIDVGGESTRPQGATAVSADEEIRRVVPIVNALRRSFDALISVDTTKSSVAAAAIDAGADIINDVSGFRLDPRMGEIAARTSVGVILMHSRGTVSDMGTYTHAVYSDVTAEVIAELGESVGRALSGGVAREAIVVDPGIGFAKRSEHSVSVLNELPRIIALGFPVLVGVSRKRFVGELAGVQTPDERTAGTLGANVVALTRGARLFRVHDVAPNRQALDVAWGILRAGTGTGEPGPDKDRSYIRSQFPVPGSQQE